jgi:DNA-directed RNA polymerase specialized sigma24 family protein
MSSPGSVTHWIGLLRAGESAAAQPLWERYFRRLVGLARVRLQGAPRAASDEEDVALSAFKSFCLGAEHGRFPDLRDRDNLWPLLVVITGRKALRLRKQEQAQKRGGGRVINEADLGAGEDEEAGLDQEVGDEPTPEFAAQMIEEYRRLLEALGDDQLREIAVARMEGHTAEELAIRYRVSPRTIERKGQKIREIWSQEIDS